MVVLVPSAVDHGFESRSGQTKDYDIGVYCFSAKQAIRGETGLLQIGRMFPSGETYLSAGFSFSELSQ